MECYTCARNIIMGYHTVIAEKGTGNSNPGNVKTNQFIKWNGINSNNKKMSFLKKTSLFKGLTSSQYSSLSKICSETILPQYEIIFHQGDRSGSLFILTKGKIKIYKNEQFLADLHAPDVFGEIGFFYGYPRQYSVISAEEIRIIEINKKKLMHLITRDNLLLYSIHLNIIDEFSHHSKKYARIITGENHSR